MQSAIVEVHKLAYAYSEAGKRREILSQVDLTINVGETVALLGASGSGKSTLLNLLGGIDQPSGGNVQIKGQELFRMREPQLTVFRRDHIGYIYQLFNLIPTLTVAENTALPLELASMPAKKRKSVTEIWLDKVGLLDRRHAFPDQLSGGEQQRVAIARALIHNPALVLADEPTGNLDAGNGLRILNLLLSLANDIGQTLLIVTHSREVAQRCQRIVLLDKGRISEPQFGGDGNLW